MKDFLKFMNDDENYHNWFTWLIVWGGMAFIAVVVLVMFFKQASVSTYIM